MPDTTDERVPSHVYLTTTSTDMADERTWERKYCKDQFYRAPTEEERAKLQVSQACCGTAALPAL